MQNVVIFGAGDFAQVACTYLEADDRFRVAAFTVHERFIPAPRLLGHEVVPFETIGERLPPRECSMFVAIGYSRLNQVRTEHYRAGKAKGYSMITYVSSLTPQVGRYTIGDNCFVFEANVIQPFATIGNNVVMWSGNHIGHHVTIGDHCFVASHVVVAGRASVGEGCFLGANATIRDGVQVAPRCIIGAGALVMKDTKEGEIYRPEPTRAGSFPSRKLRF